MFLFALNNHVCNLLTLNVLNSMRQILENDNNSINKWCRKSCNSTRNTSFFIFIETATKNWSKCSPFLEYKNNKCL